MRKFRYSYKSAFLLIITVLVTAPILFIGKLIVIWYIFAAPVIIIQILCYLNIIFLSNIIVDEQGLTQKSWMFKKNIFWDDISFISNEKYPFFKYCISIHGNNNSKKILIYDWIKDSDELIKIVVDECKKRNIKVDHMIEKIIEY